MDRELKHNYIVNVIDGSFFGLGIGLASFSTIIPLFFNELTDSMILIGLIPAIHSVGWQLPQLLAAQGITNLKRLKPTVLLLTIQERLPFIGLALVALFLPQLGPQRALPLAFLLLIWQGLGSGITANAWQNFIIKIIPGDIRGTFLGVQSGAANLLAALGSSVAGVLIERVASPNNFAICFAITSFFMVISWIFLGQSRESDRPERDQAEQTEGSFWYMVGGILNRDHNFRWFIVTRILFQFSLMASAFYTVYAVRQLGVSASTAGFLGSVLLLTQVAANPFLGWVADRFSRRFVLEIGAIAALLSALIAFLSATVGWFYLVIIFSGLSSTAFWTIGITMTMDFGTEPTRPAYIGLANTLIAPFTFLSPLIGGWLADYFSFQSTFLVSAIASLVTAAILHLFLKDPRVRATA